MSVGVGVGALLLVGGLGGMSDVGQWARAGIPMSVGGFAWGFRRLSACSRGDSDVGRWALVEFPMSFGGLAREFNVSRWARVGIPMSVGALRSKGLREDSDVGRWAVFVSVHACLAIFCFKL